MKKILLISLSLSTLLFSKQNVDCKKEYRNKLKKIIKF